MPGVFLNDCYKYSIKAFTYSGGRTIPLPRLMVSDLMERLGVKRLSVRPTYTDTCIISKEVDKGTGMKALLEMVGLESAETTAIGDTEPDLAAFRVATHSFAPSNCTCKLAARSIGCKVFPAPMKMACSRSSVKFCILMESSARNATWMLPRTASGTNLS